MREKRGIEDLKPACLSALLAYLLLWQGLLMGFQQMSAEVGGWDKTVSEGKEVLREKSA